MTDPKIVQEADTAQTDDKFGASVGKNASIKDGLTYEGKFEYRCEAPVEDRREEYIRLRDRILFNEERKHLVKADLNKAKTSWFIRLFKSFKISYLEYKLKAIYKTLAYDIAAIAQIPMYLKWTDEVHNLIPTVGKNNMLDNHFSASAFTAAWFMGLIDNAGFTAVANGDTMASHAGWAESTAYSNATRIATAWSAAAAGVKSLSAALGFLINATATLNGGFITSVNTKGGTTGTLTSAGSFTGGTRAVINGDTVNVSYSATLT